jgi:signal transduction histidine kinase
MSSMYWSIRYQLLVPLLLLLVGVVGMSAWTAVASAHRAWQQIETQVRNVAATLSTSHYPLTANVLEQARGLSGAEYLLIDDTGRSTTTLSNETPYPPEGTAVADDWRHLHLGSQLTVNGDRYLCSGVRLQQPGAGTHGTLYILYPEALWRDALWQSVRPSLILGGFVGLGSLILALGVAQRLARRIGQLERRTREIAAGDFSPMPLAGRRDELRDLGQSINEMAARLAQLQEAVQKNERLRLLGQVSGGLAHQLRNGVTGAILAVQLHARSCTGGDAEALDVALRQLAILESNLKRFLDLGRANEQVRERCDITATIDETIALVQPQCRHMRVSLRWQKPMDAVWMKGDNAQLGHLFLNVLSNAVEAAGPGGSVEVRTQATDGCCRVDIVDSGPGPSATVASRLFEPFVTDKQGGVGLGLVVAQQVAQTHGGNVSWHREEERTCFRIELPVS